VQLLAPVLHSHASNNISSKIIGEQLFNIHNLIPIAHSNQSKGHLNCCNGLMPLVKNV
jgi:hypothetical protein